MKINKLWLLSSVLAWLPATVLEASVPRTCDPNGNCPTCCHFDSYPQYVAPGQIGLAGGGLDGEDIIVIGEEDPCGMPVCRPIEVAPFVVLQCQHESGTVHCEAWPRAYDPGYLFSYRWLEVDAGQQPPSLDPGLAGVGEPESMNTLDSYWSYDFTADFSCADEKQPYVHAEVSVRSPYGLTSSTSVLVPCTDD